MGTTATASVSVGVHGHEGGRRAAVLLALTTKADNLAILLDGVVLKDLQLHFFLSVTLTLRLVVHLLLALLLTTTDKSVDEGDSGFVNEAIVSQGAVVLKGNFLGDDTLLFDGNA